MSNGEEATCCGSGCTNCVLDLRPGKQVLPIDVGNVFDRTYKQFTCVSIGTATENVFRLRFQYVPAAGDDRSCLIVPPGSHLYLRMPKIPTQHVSTDQRLLAWRAAHYSADFSGSPRKGVEKYDKSEDDLYISRPYTPITYDRTAGTFDVLVKMEPGGSMTDHLLTLSVGGCTEWKGLYGDFVWSRNRYAKVIAFVQGVAIAPVYSTLNALLADDEDDTRWMLCACFRDLDNVLLRDELRSMASYWNFKYEIYLSRRSCSGAIHPRYNEPIYDQRLEPKDVERLLQPLPDENHSPLVLLCGTESFVAFIKASLQKLRIENCYTF